MAVITPSRNLPHQVPLSPNGEAMAMEMGSFYGPSGKAVDAKGNVYVVDTYNQRIQKFNSSALFYRNGEDH